MVTKNPGRYSPSTLLEVLLDGPTIDRTSGPSANHDEPARTHSDSRVAAEQEPYPLCPHCLKNQLKSYPNDRSQQNTASRPKPTKIRRRHNLIDPPPGIAGAFPKACERAAIEIHDRRTVGLNVVA